jgi:hypothetical protein
LARSKHFLRGGLSHGGELRHELLRFAAATLQPAVAVEFLQLAEEDRTHPLVMASCADPDLAANDGAGGGLMFAKGRSSKPWSLLQLAHICNSVSSVTELADSQRMFVETLLGTEQGYALHLESALLLAVNAFHGAVGRYGRDEPQGAGRLLEQLWAVLLSRTRGTIASTADASALVQALAAVGDPVGCYRVANMPSVKLDAAARWDLHAVAPDSSAALTSLDSGWISGRHKPSSSCVVACFDWLMSDEGAPSDSAVSQMFVLLSMSEANRLPLDVVTAGRAVEAVCRLAIEDPDACDVAAAIRSVEEIYAKFECGCREAGVDAALHSTTLSCLEDMWLQCARRGAVGQELDGLSRILRVGSERAVKPYAAFHAVPPNGAFCVLPERWAASIQRAASGRKQLLAHDTISTGIRTADLLQDVLSFVQASTAPVVCSPVVLTTLLRLAMLAPFTNPHGDLHKALLEAPRLVIVDSLGSARTRLAAGGEQHRIDEALFAVASPATRDHWNAVARQRGEPPSSSGSLWRLRSAAGRYGSWCPAAPYELAQVRSRPQSSMPNTPEQQATDLSLQSLT